GVSPPRKSSHEDGMLQARMVPVNFGGGSRAARKAARELLLARGRAGGIYWKRALTAPPVGGFLGVAPHACPSAPITPPGSGVQAGRAGRQREVVRGGSAEVGIRVYVIGARRERTRVVPIGIAVEIVASLEVGALRTDRTDIAPGGDIPLHDAGAGPDPDTAA